MEEKSKKDKPEGYDARTDKRAALKRKVREMSPLLEALEEANFTGNAELQKALERQLRKAQ